MHALDESVADLDGAGPLLDGDRARGAGVGECRGETADVSGREELVRTENEVRRHRRGAASTASAEPSGEACLA